MTAATEARVRAVMSSALLDEATATTSGYELGTDGPCVTLRIVEAPRAWRGNPPVPRLDPEERAEMFDWARDELRRAGLAVEVDGATLLVGVELLDVLGVKVARASRQGVAA